MNKYEAMFIVRTDLNEADKKTLQGQITEAITKNEGKIVTTLVWAERKKLTFDIKKFKEADYFLVNFEILAEKINAIKEVYRLNESILRLIILKNEK